ncbi:response regulator [Sphingobium estronivorans]|uniref:response regulator n=1 Tax=Sphingobium estronivorans TaxID=1577690 RepID=UPI001F073CE8|nr:response regulator [Sphingobium estronivorans]
MTEAARFGGSEYTGKPRFDRPMVILVVEDEALVNMNICEFLIDEEFTVFSARGANEALMLMEALDGSVDLLFTDVNMPGGMDGFDLVRLAQERWPAVKILIATGGRDSSDLPSDLQKFGPMLMKPYRLEVMANTVSNILSN